MRATGFALPILVCLMAASAVLSLYIWHDALLDARLKRIVREGDTRRLDTIAALISEGAVETSRLASLSTLFASAPHREVSARLLLRSLPPSPFVRYGLLRLDGLQEAPQLCPAKPAPKTDSRESDFSCAPPLPPVSHLALRGDLRWNGMLELDPKTERIIAGGAISGPTLRVSRTVAVIAIGDIHVDSLQPAAGYSGAMIALASILGTVRVTNVTSGLNFCVSARAAELPASTAFTQCATSPLLRQHTAVPLALRFGEID